MIWNLTNCFMIQTHSLFTMRVGFLDVTTEEYSDLIFWKHHLKIKVSERYESNHASPYIIRVVKIRKKDFPEFLESVRDLAKLISSDGNHLEYESNCNILFDKIEASKTTDINNYATVLSYIIKYSFNN